MEVDVLGHTVRIDDSMIAESSDEITRQIAEYTAGERRQFDLTVSIPNGFTGDVMTALLGIPYGETMTYGDLAAELGTAPRAVGGGCARNPVPIVVPCHRITAADGIGGFQYPGLKERLLALESSRATAAGRRGDT